jgi:hypothetical protein
MVFTLACFVAIRATWISFAFSTRELRGGVLSMLETHIVMSSLIYRLILILVFCLAHTLVLRLALFYVLCLSSLMNLTITHMVWVHERTALCLDALDTVHVLILVIIFCIGLVSLLEGLTLTLSRDIWTAHIFSVVVHVPLGQMVSCKGLWKSLLVTWLSAGFLRFISLTPALRHRPLLVLCRWWTEAWRTHDSWIPVAHISWPGSLYGSPTSPTCFRVFDSCGIWLVFFLCSWLVLVVITFLIAWTLMRPCEIWWIPWLLFLWVRMSSWTCSRDSFVGRRLCSYDASFGSSYLVPWELITVLF